MIDSPTTKEDEEWLAELDEMLGKPGPPVEVDPETMTACVESSRREAQNATTDVIAIGEFLDWLSDHGYVVAGWVAPDGWVPISEEIATKLARKYMEEQHDQ